VAAACRGFARQALHAFRLSLTHPVTRERLALEAPVPADLAALIAATGL
jgi:23S rRNA pseudouridine1911/1915/1917 synthase